MASILAIKRRIKTARNVSKTTKALQMISASKLKRAQDAALASRPYVEKLNFLSQELREKVDADQLHDYMVKPENTKAKLIIVISPDKGLCGGMITNVVREVANLDPKEKLYFITIGKRATKAVASLDKEIIASFDFGNTLPPFDIVYTLTKLAEEYFLGKKVSEVQILYTKFVNVFTVTPQFKTILPMELEEMTEKKDSVTIFEPTLSELMPSLLQHNLEMVIYQSLLENYASEQASRMVAMKNSTDSAMEMIGELQLEYNKTRQSKITSEILDIGGAQAAINNG